MVYPSIKSLFFSVFLSLFFPSSSPKSSCVSNYYHKSHSHVQQSLTPSHALTKTLACAHSYSLIHRHTQTRIHSRWHSSLSHSSSHSSSNSRSHSSSHSHSLNSTIPPLNRARHRQDCGNLSNNHCTNCRSKGGFILKEWVTCWHSVWRQWHRSRHT